MSDGLYLEKMKIAERLTTLETKFVIYIEQTQENNTKLNHIILGNGEQGLVDKVRNLEKTHNKLGKYTNAAWLAVIGLACKSLWDTIVGK